MLKSTGTSAPNTGYNFVCEIIRLLTMLLVFRRGLGDGIKSTVLIGVVTRNTNMLNLSSKGDWSICQLLKWSFVARWGRRRLNSASLSYSSEPQARSQIHLRHALITETSPASRSFPTQCLAGSGFVWNTEEKGRVAALPEGVRFASRCTASIFCIVIKIFRTHDVRRCFQQGLWAAPSVIFAGSGNKGDVPRQQKDG